MVNVNRGLLLLGYGIICFCQESGRTLYYGKRYRCSYLRLIIVDKNHTPRIQDKNTRKTHAKHILRKIMEHTILCGSTPTKYSLFLNKFTVSPTKHSLFQKKFTSFRGNLKTHPRYRSAFKPEYKE